MNEHTEGVRVEMTWFKNTYEERVDALPTETSFPLLLRVDKMATNPLKDDPPVWIPEVEYFVAYSVCGVTGALMDEAGDDLGWNWRDVTWVCWIKGPLS